MQEGYWLSRRNKFIVDGAKLCAARCNAPRGEGVEKGFSMEEVAEALGCNKSSVSRWEQSKLQPSEQRIKKMAEMFGTVDFVQVNSKNRNLVKATFLGEGKQ